MVLDTSVRSEILRPFVPRLVIDWLRETPEATHRMVDGTLAFVDISGFTALTERLARKGKIGAEELDEILNATFTELLAVAYADGAGLVKWGGDAVLLLFAGEDHAARACRAAHRMRRTIRRVGHVQTSAGRATLRMSIGIHSGAFDFFLVGDPMVHRELVIAGLAATRCAAVEGIAGAGEIALSLEAAAFVDPRVLGDRKDGAVLLAREPRAMAAPADVVPDVSGLELDVFVPLAIREHVLAGLGEAEHRAVTAGFIEFMGTDRMLEREGPASLAAALDEVIRSVQASAARHEVSFFETDIAKDGGKIMLIAGAPRSTGEDEERMLLAARDVVDNGARLALRIGINAGHVFSGVFGPSFRRTYSVKGDAVNLAARLMAKAIAGEILTTARVFERSQTVFETEPLEPFLVKGKAEPVQAFRLGPILTTRVEDVGTQLPLVAREAEMATLTEALSAAGSGRGAIVELIGEPGLGKSRLVEELRTIAEGFVTVTVACEPYASSTPYFPFRALLRDLLGVPPDGHTELVAKRLRDRVELNAGHLLPWLPLLGAPLDVPLVETEDTRRLDGEFRRARLEAVMADFLACILPTPTVVVFEDVHWMDDASSGLLRRIAGGLAAHPWLICVTRRELEQGFVVPPGTPAVSLRLEPLGADQTVTLANAAIEENPIPPHVVSLLVERSGGNPLFLRELLAAAGTTRDVVGLPETLEAVIASQIDRLPPVERTLLRHVSVLGARFREDLARAVVGAELGLGESWWERVSSFLLPAEPGTLRFAHALIRDAAYAGLPYRRRRQLHERVGRAIESSAPNAAEQAEVLSYHFFLADSFADAWRYSRIAGERATSLYANAEASRFFRRALEAARRISVDVGDRATVLRSLGEVEERLGRYGLASDAYRAARRLLDDDPIARAELIRREAWIREAAGRFADAVRWHRKGLRLLEGSETNDAIAARAKHLVGIASMRHAQGRFEESIQWCHRAIEEAERSDTRHVVAHAAYLLDWMYDELGRRNEAPYPGLALKIYEELGDPVGQANVLNNLGMFAYFRGDWNEAIELYERSREARLKIGDEVNAAYGTANIAEILADQGRLEDAEARFRDALRVWRAAGYRQGIAFAVENLGKIAGRMGRFDEGMSLLEESRAAFEDVGFSNYVWDVDARIAEILVLRGDAHGALAAADSALAKADAAGGMPALTALLQRIRGYALAQVGSLEQARAAFDESLRQARERNARFEIALTLEAIVRVARMEGRIAAEAAADAAEIFEELGVTSTPEVPLAAAIRA